MVPPLVPLNNFPSLEKVFLFKPTTTLLIFSVWGPFPVLRLSLNSQVFVKKWNILSLCFSLQPPIKLKECVHTVNIPIRRSTCSISKLLHSSSYSVTDFSRLFYGCCNCSIISWLTYSQNIPICPGRTILLPFYRTGTEIQVKILEFSKTVKHVLNFEHMSNPIKVYGSIPVLSALLNQDLNELPKVTREVWWRQEWNPYF